MKVPAHPRFQIFRRRLQARPELLQRWTGAAYRMTTLEYPDSQNILMGQGSFLHESLTQAIGRAFFGLKGEGLLVPSARVPGGINVVYLPQTVATTVRYRHWRPKNWTASD